ncbi:hypothetical protein [Mesomycoplasma ovipneumoniae]|uniref:Uncharacterized protein n=1 Tax=Mesomycoplasma ovipneumoniae TaxID=29562 RepID=A0AAP6CU78_9BACT|nr:hypothetical protein [Mesomycoplasma ovipneumoniae]MDW2912800.1 hypothetical protein [Mesomycoplasma ovipneumoniae]MDW2916579.1 hypothetical protein [Mesomycoplasma ovipneumoniae]MDW2917419.1 hypothetical protein [Mesomycoplasma ovipneumoniae]MDW2924182.1 hypothetical protein [Mesomycoplasma ovipneumoniae]MDW2928756.1 hypothetical protein [Mesomycoplasma ovipneumoniae]
MAKVNYNFFTDLLKYQSKNHPISNIWITSNAIKLSNSGKITIKTKTLNFESNYHERKNTTAI